MYVVLDTETTGFSEETDRIIEIGALREDGASFQAFVHCDRPLPHTITLITGISDIDLLNAREERDVFREFFAFAGLRDYRLGKGDLPLFVAHNAPFDRKMLQAMVHRQGWAESAPLDRAMWIDTASLARRYWDPPVFEGEKSRYTLGNLCRYKSIALHGAHRALQDVYATHDLLKVLLQEVKADPDPSFDPRGFELRQRKKVKP